jgi:hypothetical protein
VSGGQELAGLSHMSEAYGREVLADATATSLIAHELAHQWWGKASPTFMAAAYKEQARGREAYLADVARWRRRIEQLRASGTEKPLVCPDWNRPTADDRALVYQKGALALHTLRETLGETAFWAALRAYTREFAGKAGTARPPTSSAPSNAPAEGASTASSTSGCTSVSRRRPGDAPRCSPFRLA